VPPSGTASQKNCLFLLEKIGRAQKKCKGNFSARLCSDEQGGGATLWLGRRQKEKGVWGK